MASNLQSSHADGSGGEIISARNNLSHPDDRKAWTLKATIDPDVEYSPQTSDGRIMPIFSPLTEKTKLDLIEDKSEKIFRYSIRKSEDEDSTSWIPIGEKEFNHLQSGGTLLIDNMVIGMSAWDQSMKHRVGGSQ